MKKNIDGKKLELIKLLLKYIIGDEFNTKQKLYKELYDRSLNLLDKNYSNLIEEYL